MLWLHFLVPTSVSKNKRTVWKGRDFICLKAQCGAMHSGCFTFRIKQYWFLRFQWFQQHEYLSTLWTESRYTHTRTHSSITCFISVDLCLHHRAAPSADVTVRIKDASFVKLLTSNDTPPGLIQSGPGSLFSQSLSLRKKRTPWWRFAG